MKHVSVTNIQNTKKLERGQILFHSTVWDCLLTTFFPLWPQCDVSFQQDSSPCRSSHHLKLVLEPDKMTSTVSRSQVSGAPWGCGEAGDSHHGWTAAVWRLPCPCGPKPLSTVLNLSHEEWNRLWRRRVSLIKWQVPLKRAGGRSCECGFHRWFWETTLCDFLVMLSGVVGIV